MSDLGYSEDILRLALISHRERDEMMEQLKLVPGHKERMSSMFKVIDQMNPRNAIVKALQTAHNGQS